MSGFYFPTKIKANWKKHSNSVTITSKAVTAKMNTGKTNYGMQTFSTLGDMLLKRYVQDFIAQMQGDPVLEGEVGEWRIYSYTGGGTIYSHFRGQSADRPMEIKHRCGPVAEGQDPWMTAWVPGDKRRRLCLNCKKRVPEQIKALMELVR